MTSSNPSDRPTTGTGASPVGEDRRRKRPWWLLILVVVLVIVGVILLLSRCGGGDTNANDAASPADSAANSATTSTSPSDNADVSTPAATSPGTSTPATSTPATSTPATSTAAVPATGAGSLTADGTSLLPIATAGGAGGDLSHYIGDVAAAKGVMVLSAPADNGFWVGTSTTDRVYVHLLQPGLVSPHPVQAGDRVSFAGTVVANGATLAADDGVDAAEGADQLTAQKAHLEIAKSSVVFTG